MVVFMKFISYSGFLRCMNARCHVVFPFSPLTICCFQARLKSRPLFLLFSNFFSCPIIPDGDEEKRQLRVGCAIVHLPTVLSSEAETSVPPNIQKAWKSQGGAEASTSRLNRVAIFGVLLHTLRDGGIFMVG